MICWLESLGITPSTFWDSIGAAFGGFLGVVFFFFIRLGIEKYLKRPRVIREYLCVTPLSRGNDPERKWELEHHRGKELSDAGELKRLGIVGHNVWEWSRDPTPVGIAKGAGECLFFGPYNYDANEPGMYVAQFRVLAEGFSTTDFKTNDWDLLMLDVLRTRKESGYSTSNDKVISYPIVKQDLLKTRTVRASELARAGWHSYDLVFYSDGGGMLEYRCSAFDGKAQKQDHLSLCGDKVRMFFDTVVIKRLSGIQLPAV
jgi:hypothetical protein